MKWSQDDDADSNQCPEIFNDISRLESLEVTTSFHRFQVSSRSPSSPHFEATVLFPLSSRNKRRHSGESPQLTRSGSPVHLRFWTSSWNDENSSSSDLEVSDMVRTQRKGQQKQGLFGDRFGSSNEKQTSRNARFCKYQVNRAQVAFSYDCSIPVRCGNAIVRVHAQLVISGTIAPLLPYLLNVDMRKALIQWSPCEFHASVNSNESS
jgi:hypothetical protein